MPPAAMFMATDTVSSLLLLVVVVAETVVVVVGTAVETVAVAPPNPFFALVMSLVLVFSFLVPFLFFQPTTPCHPRRRR